MSDTTISALKPAANGSPPPRASISSANRIDQTRLVDRPSAVALFATDLLALAAGIGGSDFISQQARIAVPGIHEPAGLAWLSQSWLAQNLLAQDWLSHDWLSRDWLSQDWLSQDWLSWGAALTLVASSIGFMLLGHYTNRVPRRLETSQIAATIMAATFLGALIQSVLTGPATSLSVLMVWLVAVPLVVVSRALTKSVLLFSGLWSIRTLILGAPDAIEAVCAALRADPLLGFDVVGGTDPDGLATEGFQPGLSRFLNLHRTGFVVIAPGTRDPRVEQELIEAVDRTLTPYSVLRPIPDFARLAAGSGFLVGNGLKLSFDCPGNNPVKAAFDVVGAAFLLVFLSPVFFVLSCLIRLDGGPALFAHRRIGNGGRRFQCLKFRTMVTNADDVLRQLLNTDAAAALEWEATQKLRNDPRVTRFGRVLRRTSLDELPQLINVLRREMSLVGPRPIVENEMPRYGDQIEYYMEARPGMTGLWQVSGRSDTSYAERVRLDVRYVREWSFWRDLGILAKTISVVIRRRGAA